jgi:hypothetical protein
MTKKDFIALAEHIRDNREFYPDLAVLRLADHFGHTYPAFNRERWLGYVRGLNGPCGGTVQTPEE